MIKLGKQEKMRTISIALIWGAAIVFLAVAFGPNLMLRWNGIEKVYNNLGVPARVDYGHVIGIELGRDYSRVGVIRAQNEFEIIPDWLGRTTIPNYVAFPKIAHERFPDGPIVGFEAKDQARSNPQNTFYDFRRLLGRNQSHPDVQRAIRELPYKIFDNFPTPMIRQGVKNNYIALHPERFTGMILSNLKTMAEHHLNATVKWAVITVPFEFDFQQRNAILKSAKKGGLNVLRLVDEPTAVGYAYQLDMKSCNGEWGNVGCKYAIYRSDERGAHLSLLHVGKLGFEVLGTVYEEPESSFWASILRQIPFVKSRPSKIELEAGRLPELVEELLVKSGKVRKDINGLIVITTNTTLTSTIEAILEAHFPDSKTVQLSNRIPDQSIVRGASIAADRLLPKVTKSKLKDATLLSLGIETKNGSFLRIIPRNTLTPTRGSAVVYMTANHGLSSVYLPIYEGEHELASRNYRLGHVVIDLWDVGDGRWGENGLMVELVFEFDQNEILTVWTKIGGDDRRRFLGPALGRRWRWKEIEEVVKEVNENKEEDLKILREGGIEAEGGLVVEAWWVNPMMLNR